MVGSMEGHRRRSGWSRSIGGPAGPARRAALALSAVLLLSTFGCSSRTSWLDGLGLEPPGGTPVRFEPAFLGAEARSLHGPLTFAPDGREVVWSVIPPAVAYTRRYRGGWEEPQDLTIGGRNPTAALFDPDGRRLWFQGILEGGLGGVDLWYMERTPDGWSPPVNPGSPLNSSGFEGQPSLTMDGDVYLAATLEGVAWDRGIFVARRAGNGWATPEALPTPVNSPALDLYPLIAPDGSFLLFSSSRPGLTEADLRLHVSFCLAERGWSEPVNLSALLGIEETARFASLSPDGRYLFFETGGAFHWVSATVLQHLRLEPP